MDWIKFKFCKKTESFSEFLFKAFIGSNVGECLHISYLDPETQNEIDYCFEGEFKHKRASFGHKRAESTYIVGFEPIHVKDIHFQAKKYLGSPDIKHFNAFIASILAKTPYKSIEQLKEGAEKLK